MTSKVISYPFVEGETLIGDRFRVLKRIGIGGMGIVYLVRDEKLFGEQVFALKMLQPTLHPSQLPQYDARTFLIEEVRTQIKLIESRSDHFVPIIDYGTANVAIPAFVEAAGGGRTRTVVELDLPYYVMEYLSGANLEDVIKHLKKETRFLPWGLVVAVCTQAAFALSLAHAQGIVHKDVKPNNLYLTDRGNRVVLKLIDWGVAGKHGTRGFLGSGTDRYGAPELQMRRSAGPDSGELEDVQSDIFSLGLTFYELSSLYHAFYEHRANFTYAHNHEMPTPLRVRRADAPPGLEELFLKMFAKKPADRPTAAEVVKTLEAIAVREGYGDPNVQLLELFASMKSELSVRRRKAGEPTEIKAKVAAKSEVFFKPQAGRQPEKTEEMTPAAIAEIVGGPSIEITDAPPETPARSSADERITARKVIEITDPDSKLPFSDEELSAKTNPYTRMPFAVIDEQKDDRKFRSMAGVFKEIEAIETSYVSSPFDRVEGDAAPRRPEVKAAAEMVRVQANVTEEMPVKKAAPAPPEVAFVAPPRAAPRDERERDVSEDAWLANAEAETVDGPLTDQARRRKRLIRTAWGLSVSVALTIASLAAYRTVAHPAPSPVIAAAPAAPVAADPTLVSQVPPPSTASATPSAAAVVTPASAAPLSAGRVPRAQHGPPSTSPPRPATAPAESSTPVPPTTAPSASSVPSASPAASAASAAPPDPDREYTLKKKISR